MGGKLARVTQQKKISTPSPVERKTATRMIAIVDVGHGNCAVIRDGENVSVIDCGGRGAALLAFLEQEGISRIQVLFLSHADQDHIGGLLALLGSGKVVINNIFANTDGSKDTELWDDLTYELSMQNEQGKTNFKTGISRTKDRISVGDISIAITGPTPYLAQKGVGNKDRHSRTISSNSISASFHILWKDNPVVYLAGDLDQISLDDLAEHGADLRAPVLVFPHHGGASGHHDVIKFTEQLCRMVNPETIVFSIGRTKFENPRPEIVNKIREILKGVRISCTQMSVHCAKKLPFFTEQYLSPLYAKGRELKECCGGTFVIEMGEAIVFNPDKDNHYKFILNTVPKSMCLH